MAYPRTLITAPTVEPVSLAEARAHLQEPPQQDDGLIAGLVITARTLLEQITLRAFVNQTWDVFLEEFPDDEEIYLPFGKVQSVTYLKYTDSDNTQTTFSSSYYHVDTASEPGELVLAYGQVWPTVVLKTSNPIVIRAVFGYGSAGTDVPYPLRQAILLLVEHYYNNRGVAVISDRAGARDVTLPWTIEALIGPYRLWA